MNRRHYDLIVIGGGPAGMAAAVSAKEHGLQNVLLLDRNSTLGGILPQCIHDGFGLYLYRQALTGPEYAQKWADKIMQTGVSVKPGSTVLDVSYTIPFAVTYIDGKTGLRTVIAQSLVFAMGCREKPLGKMRIPGSRPAGIYTAGAAQYMMNMQNIMPGKRVVILGSGDIGLIMARRLTLEGAQVKLILGQKASGLLRNHVQCVQDFGLPILFEHTLISTHGYQRLKGVTMAPLNSDGTPNLTRKRYIQCDTLLVATGLIPETELWRTAGIPLNAIAGIPADQDGQTMISGVFACGNVTHVYDVADMVTQAGFKAGAAAAGYVLHKNMEHSASNELLSAIDITEPKYGDNRALQPDEIICILCPSGCRMQRHDANGHIAIAGYGCKQGLVYAQQEMSNPVRTLTTTIKVINGAQPLVPVKNALPLPKAKLFDIMKKVRNISVTAPINIGQTITVDAGDVEIALIATANVAQKEKSC